MRRNTDFLFLVSTFVLVACTSTGSGSSTSLSSPNSETITTSASLQPPTGETGVECDSRAISESYGEKIKLEKCTATWAMGDTDRDSWQCESEGCRQTRIFHLDAGKWINTATCDRTLPLTRFASSCFVPNVGLATADLVPPQDVACIIWTTNTLPQYVKETGCTLNQDAVLASLRTKCDDTFDATQLPLQKCDRGDIVRQLQERLRELNYKITASGFFGPDTSQAVFDFQKSKNLLTTAIVDEETWLALGLPQ